MQTLIRRGVGDAAAGLGLGLHFLHMSEGPFSLANYILVRLHQCQKVNLLCDWKGLYTGNTNAKYESQVCSLVESYSQG